MPADTKRIAVEWLACADALRTVRSQLSQLMHDSHVQELRKNMDVEELIALLAPCLHPAGSEAKIALLQARAEAGVELFQPGDSWRRRTS